MSDGSLQDAVVRLSRDGFVGYPTETVWGLGASALSAVAVSRLQAWKGRSDSQPISILVAGAAQLEELEFEISGLARALMDRFWPGALTLVLPCRARALLAPGIAGRGGAVGVRFSSHPVAQGLAAAAAQAGIGPLTSTSFNRHGDAPARDYAQATRAVDSGATTQELLDRPFVIDPAAHDACGEPPSTVLDLTGSEPRVLREGALGVSVLAAMQDDRAVR